MAVKNLLSQSIFQAKKLKEASAQIVKESLLSDLTKDMKRMIRQQEQQEIPNQEQEDLLEDLTEPQEDQKILTDNQEDLVNEDQEILTNDQEEEVPPEQQLNDEELNEIIQELQNDQEEYTDFVKGILQKVFMKPAPVAGFVMLDKLETYT